MANTIEILVTAKNLTKPTFDTVGEQARSIGQKSGEEFSKGFEDEVKDKIPPAVDEPLNDLPPKGREKGKETGQQFSAGLSPLLTAAFVGAATVGPAAILAGVSTAVVGAAALVSQSNAQVAQDTSILGEQVKTALQNAVAPVAGDVDAAINTLEQGVTRVTPELDQLFAAAGPDATELASGLDQLAEGALPGIVSGVRAFAPEMHDVATDLGKLGQGFGGFVGGLSAGASGSTTAFNALTKSLSELLPDVGQIIGYLSNGLGPAVADVVPVIDGAAKAVTTLTGALSPGEIQAAALAVAGLFGAFKIAGMTGAIEEGATFSSFLKGTPVAAKDAEGALTSFASKGVKGLSAALDLATGPLGLVIAGAGVLGSELGKLSGVGDHTTANVDALTSAMADAANGSAKTQGNIDELANAFTFMATGPLHATNGLKSMDDALTKLYQTNPQQAASEFGMLSKSLEANRVSADQVAKDFPQYTQAVADAKLQSHLLGTETDQLTAGLLLQATTAKTSAQASAQTTLAALGATDGQGKLTLQLYNSLTAYSAATTGASAYQNALTALNGTTQTVDDAQNNLAQQMLNAKTSFKENGYSLDLNTQAGIDNRDALSAAAKAITQLGVAQYQATGNIGNANDVIQAQINQFVKNTGATGKNKDAIYQYLESLAKIPPNVTTDVNVNVNTAYAYKQIGSLMNYINSQTGFITIGTSTGHGFGAQATGGIVGGIGAAASGGVRGSWTWVGEHGPELLPLSPGTHVMSAPDSQRIAAEAMQGASGSAGGALELSVAEGSDSAVATMIMRLVRDGKLTIRQKAIVK